MSKTIVLCFDGTNNTFDGPKSNVLRLSAWLDRDTQKTFYDPGVGTLTEQSVFRDARRSFDNLIGLAFGKGLFDNLSEGYQYLMSAYEPGTKVFVFGFSRGAYTARLLAGMLTVCGLLHKGEGHLWPYAVQAYLDRSGTDKDGESSPDWSKIGWFKKHFGRECPVHFLGLFDTVGAIGSPTKKRRFLYTDTLRGVTTARHALALDERRGFYAPPLLRPSTKADIKQVWFSGVHSDIGGGYETDENGLSRIALEWMTVEAKTAGLRFDAAEAQRYLSTERPLSDPLYELHNTMNKGWPVLELFSRTHYDHGSNAWVTRANHGRSRSVPEDATVHASVFERIRVVNGYDPTNLPEAYQEEPWSHL